VTITWYVGVGTGVDALQKPVEDKVIENFNNSQDKIELKVNYTENKVAIDTLATLIAAGTAPDIVGPVGFSGANAFSGQWLDLQPLVDKTGYDLKQYSENLVKLYQTSEGLLGIPFAVYPSLMYYNVELFDEAGLAYPPAKYGDKYELDGKEVDWDWNTVAEIAKRLTVDANGNDATSADFDPSKVEQFGFIHQWGSMRADLSTFGGGAFWDAATNKITISDAWREEAKWVYNGLWKDHFIPDATYENSDLFKPTAFASGKVAMARVMLWYTCCVGDMKAKWDIGAVPMYEGQYYSPTDADTFRIMKSTQHPDEAFTVLQYFLGDAALDLLTTYGAYAARPDLQEAGAKAKADKYPFVKNWSVVAPSLDYAVAPNHESDYPNFNKGQNRFADFRTLLYSDTGKDLDVDAEVDKLQSDLQAIVDEKK
jgi:multiple sugar transport system substrate-binding protein